MYKALLLDVKMVAPALVGSMMSIGILVVDVELERRFPRVFSMLLQRTYLVHHQTTPPTSISHACAQRYQARESE